MTEPEPPQDHDAARAEPERRHLYRILHVQPEAPAEVIKASYRALMSSLRTHPDLGGDTDRAALINAAYAVLRDPERRAAYDQSLLAEHLARPPAAPAQRPPPAPPMACAFCGHLNPARPGTGSRCGGCNAPLMPAPTPERVPGEMIGRRRGSRVALEIDATLTLRHQPRPVPAVLRDVSVTGLSLACLPALAPGLVIRVTTERFDALARVVACRAVEPAHLVRAELLTLALSPTARSAAGNTRY